MRTVGIVCGVNRMDFNELKKTCSLTLTGVPAVTQAAVSG